jgi:hypothetical protein
VKPNIIKAVDAYGKDVVIDKDQYVKGVRTQITLYTETGIRLCDWHLRMRWNKPSTIHRANIATAYVDE